MRFTREEITRARALAERGLGWRPSLGDWYVTCDNFVSFIRGHGEVLHVAERHTWLPVWKDCRRWLAEHGCRQPEFPVDEPGRVRIEVAHTSGRVIAGSGATDLACMYAIMAQLLDD
jgi:hypothetical protein